MRMNCIFVMGSLLLPVASCRQLSNSPTERVLFREDFDSFADGSNLPVGWWSEGSKAVRIENGRLRADANLDNSDEDYGTSTVWLDKTFSGDIRVEFDAHVLESEGDKNNINFFLLFSDPSGKSLRETKDDRADGQYGKYHKLNGYVITYLANGNPGKARFRFRDDPGFNLLQEEFAYECRQNQTYHIAVTKKGDRITYAVDGAVWLDKADDAHNPEHQSGIIGFRTWHTDLWWDNIKVTQL